VAVNVSAKFKRDDQILNGLTAIEEALVGDPLRRHYIIAEIGPKFGKIDYEEGGVTTPTVKLYRVEPVEGDAAETAKTLLLEAYAKRTGNRAELQGELPLDGADGGLGSVKRPDAWLGEPDPDAWKPSDRPAFKAPESADDDDTAEE
jgi:hypothetical protein